MPDFKSMFVVVGVNVDTQKVIVKRILAHEEEEARKIFALNTNGNTIHKVEIKKLADLAIIQK